MELDVSDIVWIKKALDDFIKVGNLELTNSKAQRKINERVALTCKKKLDARADGLTRDECRIVYASLLLVHGELAEHPESDPETPAVLARLERLINAFNPE